MVFVISIIKIIIILFAKIIMIHIKFVLVDIKKLSFAKLILKPLICL